MIHFLDYRCFTFFTNFKFIQANVGEKMPDNYLALTPESLPERLCKIKEIAGKVEANAPLRAIIRSA